MKFEKLKKAAIVLSTSQTLQLKGGNGGGNANECTSCDAVVVDYEDDGG